MLLLAAQCATSGAALQKTSYAVSNAHLDTLWSWDFEEAVEKFIPATLNGNFALIEKYPGYQFNFEGAYRYQLMEEYYPEAFERLKAYVAAGRWNPIGSGLENGDVNIPSPEALFRNFLYGNNYFEDTFGKRSRDVFLPDCFGFGYALPSVASHANLTGFTTQKLFWGNTFRFGWLPFDVGMWTGPDGKGILANINANGYTSRFDGGTMQDCDAMLKLAKSPIGRNAVLFGPGGDRGGAPPEATVAAISEEINRDKAASTAQLGFWMLPLFYLNKWTGWFEDALSSLSYKNVDVQFATPDRFFAEITPFEKLLLRRHDGELLLTQHATGGYTSRAISKRWNRRAEETADAAERALVAADWLGALEYPKAEMEAIWTNLIAHQFHDDIPGTANSTAYMRSWNDLMVDIMQFAAEHENGTAGVASLMDTRVESGIPIVVNNPVAAKRTASVEATLQIPSRPEFVRVFDNEGAEVPAQVISKEGEEYRIRFIATVESMGYRAYCVQPSDTACAVSSSLRLEASQGGYVLENEKYKVTVNNGGDVASIIDKNLKGKELLRQPIRLGLFDNSPVEWPAWELNFNDYWNKAPARYVAGTPEITAEENGPARVALRIERAYGQSKYRQVVSLDAGGGIVKVDNVVDWDERGTLLKAVFDLTCKNTKATYDLGLGVIERGNNSGGLLSHKKAEVPHQKWADLTASHNSYGVSILNDGKVGIDKPDDSTLRLSLIHTPANDFTHGYVRVPAGQNVQEVGENRFSYAVYSHAGAWNQSGVQLEAAAFNQPMDAFQTVVHMGPLGGHYSFGSLSTDQVLLRAIKKAERSDEIIVRFNEGAGKNQSNVRFSLGEGIASAREVYASEEETGPARVINGELVFGIGKYGVKSFALTLKAPGVSAADKDAQVIDLRPYNNIDIYSSNANKSDGSLDDCYPSELVPDTVVFAGVPYQTGEKAEGCLSAVRAAGQTIALPAGYTALKLLAASVGGDKTADFTVGGEPITLEIADFAENIAAWDLYDLHQNGYIKKQIPAFKATHRHTAGRDNIAASTYMFLYTFDISKATEIALPDDGDIMIFAATAVNEGANGLFCVSPLHDERERN